MLNSNIHTYILKLNSTTTFLYSIKNVRIYFIIIAKCNVHFIVKGVRKCLKIHSSRINCRESHECEAECYEANCVHTLAMAFLLVHDQEPSLTIM